MLTMGDGPVANLPPGLNAYAGYVNVSGIGRTWPSIVALAATQHAHALSITTDGSPAACADVESGAMSDWTGYHVGYCEVSMVNELVAKYGRPPKLWTAHRDIRFGRHICGPQTCNYGGNLVTAADGTQWSNHGGAWDESVLSDNFFADVPSHNPSGKDDDMSTPVLVNVPNKGERLVTNVVASGHLVQVIQDPASLGSPSTGQNTEIIDLTDQWPQELAGVTA